jgi:predicted ester cyclase
MQDARTLFEQGFRFIDGRRFDEWRTMLEPDLEWVGPDGALSGPDAVIEYMAVYGAAFPDGKHAVDRVVEQGHLAVAEGVWTGTHTGTLAAPEGDVPPTGATVSSPFAVVVRRGSGDRVRSIHVYFDRMDFAVQLGLVPAAA